MWGPQLKRHNLHYALNEIVEQFRASSEKSAGDVEIDKETACLSYTQGPDCAMLCTQTLTPCIELYSLQVTNEEISRLVFCDPIFL